MYVIYGSNIEHEKHDTDCPDCDTAGEGDRSPRPRGRSDQREET